MRFNIILTTDTEYGISKYNKLPWYFPEDKEFFLTHTANAVCIMGRNTANDLQQPLHDTDCVVITSKGAPPGFIEARTFEEALNKAKGLAGWNRDVFVIGGARLFNEALRSPRLNTIFYTHIARAFKCDNFVDPILNIPGMTYTVLDTKIVAGIDTICATNIMDSVRLTFYSISK